MSRIPSMAGIYESLLQGVANYLLQPEWIRHKSRKINRLPKIRRCRMLKPWIGLAGKCWYTTPWHVPVINRQGGTLGGRGLFSARNRAKDAIRICSYLFP